MRIASKKPNTLKLHDNISGSDLEIYFRTPTAKEQAAYTNGLTKRIRNKVVNCLGECRQKHGKEILEGWREGDFGEEKDGQAVAVSSVPGHPGYREDWKDWFQQYNADLVERIAVHAFENTSETNDTEELPGELPGEPDPD